MKTDLRRRARTRSFHAIAEGLEDRKLLASGLYAARVSIEIQPHTEIRGLHGYAVVLDTIFTADSSDPQTLDAFVPDMAKPRSGWPVVLAIHGGGWNHDDERQYEAQVLPTLLKAGFAVVAPNYQLSSPGQPSWPADLDELREAVVWVRRNADAYGFDPSRIAAMGKSAGGQLAALLGTDTSSDQPSSRVAAVVDFYGPTNLTTLFGDDPTITDDLSMYLGGPPSQMPAAYADASPINHVSKSSAPTLIIQGRSDAIVPVDQSVKYSQALSRAGVSNRLITIPRAPHNFGLRVGSRDLRPTVVSFLRASLR